METSAQKSDKEVILITGSSGLIGTKLIDRLADKYQCVGLDKEGDPYAHPKAENITVDITSPDSIRAALARVKNVYGNEIASVVHLAAYYDFSGEPSSLYDTVTVQGTEKLLQALQDFTVHQFVFTSTNLVYKPTSPGQKIDEDWPLDPTWDYPESKVKTENVIHEKRGAIPAVVLRLAGAYGDEGHSIPITHQIQRIYEKSLTSYFYSGDLLHGNAFVHLDDLVDALVKTVERRKELPEEVAINISEPYTFSYDELQQHIGQHLHGEEWATLEIPKPLAKVGAWAQELVSDPFIKPWMIDRADDHYELDINRAQQLLNWQPQHDLKSTIPIMIEKLKQDPEAWYKKNNLNE